MCWPDRRSFKLRELRLQRFRAPVGKQRCSKSWQGKPRARKNLGRKDNEHM
ncbi:predicted protein [Chaetomium globosum CBS 148.51]|uniref:Uncharacterized protein n=1 Tax=Chaetomium globosum (strain ATCC 6205 / CBS 148.51 / DSM 1962 / NBRC 6347 / NRRL 1970) TaxID=306901 RepID=Q2HEK2_CHAGB|nr:uncharacterized protein CHGG_01352 [Chaetomium globosum CBS 148.51]EAQ93117.1 predicted protein [Chaetomium globosum CBS 148.51]